MSKVHLQKATRVEGNADIQVELENGRAKTARFVVQDFRGFEKFMEGKQVESAPVMVSRICGLCCTAHQVAGFRAVEAALGIHVPASVERLRQLAVYGEWIASHALSYFFLSMPDELGASHGVFELIRKYPGVAEEAFALRKAGNRIIEIVCKRAIHPTTIGLGRFHRRHSPDEIEEIRLVAREVRERVGRLLEQIEREPPSQCKIPFPAGHRVNFFAYDGRPERERFMLFDQSGTQGETFARDLFEEHMAELRVDWSLAKFPYVRELGFPQGILLTGPLSRLFLEGGILHDRELSNFGTVERLRRPAALSLDNVDLCRLLEIFWAAGQILALLDGFDPTETVGTEHDVHGSGKGIGVVEAPRGVLVHIYTVSRGVIERMRLYVATQFNNAYINMVLRDLVDRHVDGDSITPAGQEVLGRCLRTFDPCLSCATH